MLAEGHRRSAPSCRWPTRTLALFDDAGARRLGIARRRGLLDLLAGACETALIICCT